MYDYWAKDKKVVGKKIFNKYKEKFGKKAIFDWGIEGGRISFDTPLSSREELDEHDDKILWEQMNYLEKQVRKEKAPFYINVGHMAIPATKRKYSRSKLKEIARAVDRKYKKKYDRVSANGYIHSTPYWFWKITTRINDDVIYWYTEPWLVPSSSDVSLRKNIAEQRKYLFRELEKYGAVMEHLPPGGNVNPVWNSFMASF